MYMRTVTRVVATFHLREMAAAAAAAVGVPDDSNAWTYAVRGDSPDDVKLTSVILHKAIYSLGRTPVALGPDDRGREPDIVASVTGSRRTWEDGQVRLVALLLRAAFLYHPPRGSAAVELDCSFVPPSYWSNRVLVHFPDTILTMKCIWDLSQVAYETSLKFITTRGGLRSADTAFGAAEYEFMSPVHLSVPAKLNFLSAATNTMEDVITRLELAARGAPLSRSKQPLMRYVGVNVRNVDWSSALEAFYAFLYALETVEKSNEIWTAVLRQRDPGGALAEDINDITIVFPDAEVPGITIARVNAYAPNRVSIPNVELTHGDTLDAIAEHTGLLPDLVEIIASYDRVCGDTPVWSDASGVIVPTRTLRDWRARVEDMRQQAENMRRQRRMAEERARLRAQEEAGGDTGLDETH